MPAPLKENDRAVRQEVFLTAEQSDALRLLAEREGCSVSQLIRDAVDARLAGDRD